MHDKAVKVIEDSETGETFLCATKEVAEELVEYLNSKYGCGNV